MMDPERLRDLIAAGISCEHLEVSGDGHHFAALIVSPEFSGRSRVQRQQRVNALLRRHFDSGELHALSMQTLSVDEWNPVG